MAFSFDEGLTSALDRVRFALGDTTEAGALLADETILAAIAVQGEAGATSYLASGLATKLAYQPDSVSLPSGLSIRFGRVAALQKAAAGGGSTSGGARTSSRAPQRETGEVAEYIRSD